MPQCSLPRILGVGLMLGLWVWVSTLSVSPQLHHWLHKDSQSTAHQCLITQLGKESWLTGSACVLTAAPTPVYLGLLRVLEFPDFPTADYRLSPSRAPPSIYSSDTVVG